MSAAPSSVYPGFRGVVGPPHWAHRRAAWWTIQGTVLELAVQGPSSVQKPEHVRAQWQRICQVSLCAEGVYH